MKTYNWATITLEIEIMLIYSYRVSHKDLIFQNKRVVGVMQTTLPISFK